MSEISERYAVVAGRFTERVTEVPRDAWDNPAPCEGWVARDVVRHLVEWIPGFFENFGGIALPVGPSPDDDPVGAWRTLDDAIRTRLDDPAAAAEELDSPMGRVSFEEAVSTFCIADVLIHTWDLARATGLDESLDPDEVHRALVGMEPVDEMLRSSGHYGPRVEVAADADEQTRVIAFTGRQP